MPPSLRHTAVRGPTLTAAALVLALALGGCATASLTDPVNQPLAGAIQLQPPGLNVEGDVVALSFSGGGARAAAFSFGVLQGLREMPHAGGGTLLDRVALVSAVSGGSITAAYFGQHGPRGLDNFRAAYLDKDWEAELHLSMASPVNWARAYDGALNERDRLGDWLNTEVFHNGVVADLWRPGRTRTWINATDLYNGVPFAFVPAYFDALCSDLAAVRIADAVAGSMSVPVIFRPVVVAAYAPQCKSPLPDWVATAQRDRQASELVRSTARAFESYRDPARVRFVHLVDGGVADNFGLSNSHHDAPHGDDAVRTVHRARRRARAAHDLSCRQRGTEPFGKLALDARRTKRPRNADHRHGRCRQRQQAPRLRHVSRHDRRLGTRRAPISLFAAQGQSRAAWPPGSRIGTAATFASPST